MATPLSPLRCRAAMLLSCLRVRHAAFRAADAAAATLPLCLLLPCCHTMPLLRYAPFMLAAAIFALQPVIAAFAIFRRRRC